MLLVPQYDMETLADMKRFPTSNELVPATLLPSLLANPMLGTREVTSPAADDPPSPAPESSPSSSKYSSSPSTPAKMPETFSEVLDLDGAFGPLDDLSIQSRENLPQSEEPKKKVVKKRVVVVRRKKKGRSMSRSRSRARSRASMASMASTVSMESGAGSSRGSFSDNDSVHQLDVTEDTDISNLLSPGPRVHAPMPKHQKDDGRGAGYRLDSPVEREEPPRFPSPVPADTPTTPSTVDRQQGTFMGLETPMKPAPVPSPSPSPSPPSPGVAIPSPLKATSPVRPESPIFSASPASLSASSPPPKVTSPPTEEGQQQQPATAEGEEEPSEAPPSETPTTESAEQALSPRTLQLQEAATAAASGDPVNTTATTDVSSDCATSVYTEGTSYTTDGEETSEEPLSGEAAVLDGEVSLVDSSIGDAEPPVPSGEAGEGSAAQPADTAKKLQRKKSIKKRRVKKKRIIKRKPSLALAPNTEEQNKDSTAGDATDAAAAAAATPVSPPRNIRVPSFTTTLIPSNSDDLRATPKSEASAEATPAPLQPKEENEKSGEEEEMKKAAPIKSPKGHRREATPTVNAYDDMELEGDVNSVDTEYDDDDGDDDDLEDGNDLGEDENDPAVAHHHKVEKLRRLTLPREEFKGVGPADPSPRLVLSKVPPLGKPRPRTSGAGQLRQHLKVSRQTSTSSVLRAINNTLAMKLVPPGEEEQPISPGKSKGKGALNKLKFWKKKDKDKGKGKYGEGSLQQRSMAVAAEKRQALKQAGWMGKAPDFTPLSPMRSESFRRMNSSRSLRQTQSFAGISLRDVTELLYRTITITKRPIGIQLMVG